MRCRAPPPISAAAAPAAPSPASAIGCGTSRRRRRSSLTRGRKSWQPICPACCSTWRSGAHPIPGTLAFLDPPPAGAFAEARALLTELGAIDRSGRITDEGRRLRALPLPPRLARMVVDAGADGSGALAADIAAILSERGLGGDSVDLTHRLDQFRRDRSRRGEDARRMAKRWAEASFGARALKRVHARLRRLWSEPEIHNHHREYGFRVRRFAASRNDGRRGFPAASCRSPIPTASPRAAARAARSCWRTGAAPMSIRRRRCRASRFSPSRSSPAPRRRAACCLPRRSRSTRSSSASRTESRAARTSRSMPPPPACVDAAASGSARWRCRSRQCASPPVRRTHGCSLRASRGSVSIGCRGPNRSSNGATG